MNNTAEDYSLYMEFIHYIQANLTVYEIGNEEKYHEIRNDLSTLKERLSDKDLYLGVVGSFSSGKSTFINSMIHKNLLPSNAIQGTTVAASILKQSFCDDLEITYADGTTEVYSINEKALLEKYQIEIKNIKTENKIKSFFKKCLKYISKWFQQIKKRFSKNSNNDSEMCENGNDGVSDETNMQNPMIELFKKIISTEEVAENIKSVTLSYKNEHIPYNIAIVDTPGTESLNERHNEVTKNAIDNICDAIVVTIPKDKPVSEDLVEYIEQNLREHINDCIFVVTKVELLDEDENLDVFINFIKKTLEQKLQIESACVIPMPTLVYLKSVDPETKISISDIDNMSNERRSEFIRIYENGIDKIKEILIEKKNEYVKKRTLDLCERIRVKLTDNLTDVTEDFTERIQLLQQDNVKPFSDFETYAINKIDDFKTHLETRRKSKTDFVRIQFAALKSDISNELDGCRNSEQLLLHLTFSCMPVLKTIQEIYYDYLNTIKNDLDEVIQEIEGYYYNQYCKCTIQGHMEVDIEPVSFIDDDFISEYEDKLCVQLNDIAYLIGSDTIGVFKKIKSIFSNPFEKHRDMAKNKLSQTIDEMTQDTEKHMIEELERIYDDVVQNMKIALDNLIETDKDTINAYIEKTKLTVNNYKKGKERAQEFIDNLSRYVEILKTKGENSNEYQNG